MSLPDHMTKKELREWIRSRDRMFSSAQRAEASQRVMERLEQLPEFQSAQRVMLYWSLPSEVETHHFAEKWFPYKKILLPVMQGDSLVIRPFTGRTNLVERRFGVWEPRDEKGSVSETECVPELVVVPGMAFDPRGGRLGHGKGFYDRLLSLSHVQTVGVCFDFQLFDRLPLEAHDVAVQRVIAASPQEAVLYEASGVSDF